MLSKLFRKNKDVLRKGQAIPAGHRIYAIGDVHGRLDLLKQLMETILADDRQRGQADTQIILLGDLVDRGPDSAGVIDYVMNLMNSGLRIRCLAGNHEEVMLTAIEEPSPETARFFFRVGGRETLMSYGLKQDALESVEWAALAEMITSVVPQSHVEFLQNLENMIVIGDYAFVHAGINSSLPLDKQKLQTLRWIRQGFVDQDDELEKTIVYGHTISENVVKGPSRIGIDTGAYKSGKLTALALEGGEQRFLDTSKQAVAA